MKAKLSFKILFLFICLGAFVSATVAQKSPVKAEIVGEYDFFNGENAALEAATEQLIFRLLQEPETTRGLISIAENGELGEKVKAILAKHPELKNKIIFGWGKEKHPRPESSAIFWLLPNDAEMPDMGCRPRICECPTLSVKGVRSFKSRAEYPTFTADADGGDQEQITYRWTVSAGKIIEGQGTKTIKVDAAGAKEVTAKFEIIGGLEPECQNDVTFTTKIE